MKDFFRNTDEGFSIIKNEKKKPIAMVRWYVADNYGSVSVLIINHDKQLKLFCKMFTPEGKGKIFVNEKEYRCFDSHLENEVIVDILIDTFLKDV